MTIALPRTHRPRAGAGPRWVLVAAGLAAVLAGLAAVTAPLLAVAALAVAGLTAVIWRWPATASYLLIGMTPLVAGIDRGTVLPVLRPNEAFAAYLVAVLAARFLVRLRVGFRIAVPRFTGIELALGLMAVASSVLPLAWMVVRGQQITSDDLSYALVLWKYLVVYSLVRVTVHTDQQVRRCLWISMTSAAVVGLIGILQALDLFGVRAFLLTLYVPFDYTDIFTLPRGSSTLSLPAATADLLVFNLALAVGVWWKERRHLPVLVPFALLYVGGTFAAAEFSSLLGVVVGMVVVAVALRRMDLLRYAPIALGAGLVVAWPAFAERLSGFTSLQGLPDSWIVRWHNLTTYFWPQLFHGSNALLGVRPAARIADPNQGTGYVWIESGYTWLLWGGGIALLAAFFFFVWQALHTLLPRARELRTWSDVAALGAVTAVAVVAVLMIFDPHLTYRGAADCLYSLLALASVGLIPAARSAGERASAHGGGR